ncbi:helix-turn-helix domain-containing protein [Paracoccus versutus]|uniref:DNA-binding XRE family transcriptional regulator n=1 Tax=Paracoccus versutus TaxID=34007 RepID=A0A3D9XGJ2_PARVE|nr:helix-turn-helix transcriptional regulator [Paracoccus versutus]REF69625.1 DNA-binding XRE family transcriptional regulator [Paracoccus versutus]WGR58000.1 XRE family transcriptional regulator [Paracoccus versutus]SFY20709.1 DNA-binding transcriptional regulator, XRE-family HTH domain [Paracoccus pantotrophus]
MRFRIKEHRTRLGWTQDHLAKASGLTKGYLSLLEHGKRDPSAEALRSLAAAFGVDVTEMIEPDSAEAQDAIDHLAVYMKLDPEDKVAVSRIARKMLPNGDP